MNKKENASATWATRSLEERAQAYFEIRLAGSFAILAAMGLVYWLLPGLAVLIAVGISLLDIAVLALQSLLSRRCCPRAATWTSLGVAALIGSAGIHYGGGFATLSVGIFMILIMAAALVFLSQKAAYGMMFFCVGLYAALIALEISQVSRVNNSVFNQVYQSETRLVLANGLLGFILLALTAVLSGKAAESLGSWSIRLEADVERKNASLQVALQNEKNLAAALRLLSNANQLIVRERDQQRLLEELCGQITQSGYLFAWVGENEVGQSHLRVLAKAGALSHTENLQIEQSSCAVYALRDSLVQERNLHHEDIFCQECPLKNLNKNYASLSIPMQRENRLYGVLSVGVADRNFAPQEVTLLKELADDVAYALQTLQIETQRQTLTTTASRLILIRREEELWQATLQAAQSLLRTGKAALYAYDPQQNALSCSFSVGLSQNFTSSINERYHRLKADDLPASPLPVAVHQAGQDPHMAQEGIETYAVFPLTLHTKILGALAAYRSKPQPFNEADLQAGQTLANLVAVTLENIHLFAETRAKAAEQARLYAAAQDMASSLLNPAALLQTFARHLGHALEVTSIFLLSHQTQRGAFELLASYQSEAASPQEQAALASPPEDCSAALAAMLAGKAFSIQTDAETPLSPAERDLYQRYGVQSILFIPLLSQGRLVGYVRLWESRRRREFSQNEIYLAQTMASYAANIIHTTRLFSDLEESYDVTLEGWARALELRDSETGNHTRRVTEMAVRLAQTLRLPPEQIKHLRRGAILHDIGKFAVPDAILNKPGPLNAAELEVMKQHPLFAHQLISPIAYLHPALDIPYAHHEKWDGSGYPRGLRGEEIPLAARIFALADVYDALTSNRPYRQAMPPKEALDYVRKNIASHFDPVIAQVFLKMMEEELQG